MDRRGAAEILLHPFLQKNIERALLEGGPGQGKSTISQYICQVHRVRLLNKKAEIDSLPNNIKNTPVRLPFKIDLRHVASWIENQNPYKGDINDDAFKKIWAKSLESFLIGHIYSHSLLEDFTTNDFIAICKVSSILFVFDGFDEIANVQLRGEVIDFINKGINRISSNAKSIQIIITSRPAAFSDSVGFSVDNYPHFELVDITPKIINAYLEKWIKASDLNITDANEIKKLVNEKLKLPHLKDLAKSPMQLAIFISLLRTKGQSLPNKRTALYDSYINLFFDREADKSSLILEKRDLIIDIHQYLAWVLHSEAESLKNSGIINVDELKKRVKEFLAKEGHDTAIADQLFDVMKERVCALVSRVQGTFEFEVQPLREYFCAKYLYKTAPHSDAGSPRTGTKPERLYAILRNFYWQNVVRFFAGCADRGELDMIIQELKDLQNDEVLKYTHYPRIITGQILSDYVFTQAPFKVKEAASIIVDSIVKGNILNQESFWSNSESILLPVDCGRLEVIMGCIEQLKSFHKNDFADEILSIINNNPYDIAKIWEEHIPSINGKELTEWLRYGQSLKLIKNLAPELLLKLLKYDRTDYSIERCSIIFNGNRLDIVDGEKELKKFVFRSILDGDLRITNMNYVGKSFWFLSAMLHPHVFEELLNMAGGQSQTLLEHILTYLGGRGSKADSLKMLSDFEIIDEIDSKIKEYYNSIEETLKLPVQLFRNDLSPWDTLIEIGRSFFGDNDSFILLGTIAAGVKSKKEVYPEFSDLHNSNISLCKRIRSARMKSGNIKYWEKLLRNEDYLPFTLIVFFTWASYKTVINLMPKLEKFISDLTAKDFDLLKACLKLSSSSSPFNKKQQNDIKNLITNKAYSDKFIYILSLKFTEPRKSEMIYHSIESESEELKSLLKIKLEYLLKLYFSNPADISTLNQIKIIYGKVSSINTSSALFDFSYDSVEIPYPIAKEIVINSKDYPQVIVAIAEKSCRMQANSLLKPIGEIAKIDNWFV